MMPVREWSKAIVEIAEKTKPENLQVKIEQYLAYLVKKVYKKGFDDGWEMVK